MVRCDDTGNVYAHEAERYYDTADDDELAQVCMDCDEFDVCPGGCGWGMCSYYGEFRDGETDACGQFTEREEQA